MVYIQVIQKIKNEHFSKNTISMGQICFCFLHKGSKYFCNVFVQRLGNDINYFFHKKQDIFVDRITCRIASKPPHERVLGKRLIYFSMQVRHFVGLHIICNVLYIYQYKTINAITQTVEEQFIICYPRFMNGYENFIVRTFICHISFYIRRLEWFRGDLSQTL